MLLNWKLSLNHEFLLKDLIVSAFYFYKIKLNALPILPFFTAQLKIKMFLRSRVFLFFLFFSEMFSQKRVFFNSFGIKNRFMFSFLSFFCSSFFFLAKMWITYVFRVYQPSMYVKQSRATHKINNRNRRDQENVCLLIIFI